LEDEASDEALELLASAKVQADMQAFLRGGTLRSYMRHQRERRWDRKITVRYLINRACSRDGGVLHICYQLTPFDVCKEAFELAESGEDEGPICNLSLISDYLSRFQDMTSPVITAQFLAERKFTRKFLASFLYSIFRLDEKEYEDKEDPFPK